VPVIFLGHGIRAGRYDENIRTADIAPTLASLLGVNTPSGSVGRVLPIIDADTAKHHVIPRNPRPATAK
jgi:arylsulfatase A-like enzyme